MQNTTQRSFSFGWKHLWIASLTLFFTINMNYDWRTGYVAWYGVLALLFVSYVLAYNAGVSLKNLSFLLWFLSFIVFGLMSIFWCLSESVTMAIVKSLVIYFVVLLLIQFSINFGTRVDTILKGYFVATLINSLYVFLTIDVAKLGQEQLGKHMLESWNGNGIGFMTGQGVLIGYYLLRKATGKIEKILYLACIVALSALTIYTGSRTAFIMLIGELVIYFWLTHPTKVVRNVIVTGIVLIGAFYLVMKVESFYNVLGSRLEGLFAMFGGEGKVDSSADIRDVFIRNGKEWFKEKPVLGFGLNNYKVLNEGATGRFTYAHNTFIELAVNLGTVGLIWYYSIYAYLIVRLFKDIKKNSINVFLLSALIASLISQYGTVSYYDFYQNFLLLLCFFAVQQTRKKQRTGVEL